MATLRERIYGRQAESEQGDEEITQGLTLRERMGGTRQPSPVEPRSSFKTDNASDNGIIEGFVDWGAGFNDWILNVLDLPNDAFNWAAEKVGADIRVPSTRDLGADFYIGYREGEEPDTASYRAGEYTAEGLAFLAPILKTGQVVSMTANPSTMSRVAQQVRAPFHERGAGMAAAALGGEIASSTGAGFGAHYGEEAYGETGELLGGVIGGFATQTIPLGLRAFELMPWTPDDLVGTIERKALERIFPYTDKGGRARAGKIIRTLKEQKGTNVRQDIEAAKTSILEGAETTPARLTGDRDLMALEQLIRNEDPELDAAFRALEARNMKLAHQELSNLKTGDAAVQDAQDYLTGRYASLHNRLNAYMDKKIMEAQDLVDGLNPPEAREVVNKRVMLSLDKALDAARKDEDFLWDKVDKGVNTMVKPLRNKLIDIESRRATKSKDPGEIPGYIYNLVGRIDESGNFKPGRLQGRESIHEIHTLRSRILKDMRKERNRTDGKNDWQKIRYLDELQETALKMLEGSRQGNRMKNALNFSRALNERFRGGIMNTLMSSDRTGGLLSPDLTMGKIGTSVKGFENMRKILKASPAAREDMEQVLKMDMLIRLVNKQSGRLKSLHNSKTFEMNNRELLNLFPETHANLNKAIAAEEQAQWYSKAVKARMQKADRALAGKIIKVKPKTVLNTILEQKDPARSMSKELSRLNSKGRIGIKNDIIDHLYSKAKTGSVSNGEYVLSGDNLLAYWKENKAALSKPFNNKEMDRLDKIINTLNMGGKKDLPLGRAQTAMAPKKGLVNIVARIAAANFGAKMSFGGMGGSIQSANIMSSQASDFVKYMDVTTARKLLKDAIFDEKLYASLAADATEFGFERTRHWRVLQGWMVAHLVENMQPSIWNEPTNEEE